MRIVSRRVVTAPASCAGSTITKRISGPSSSAALPASTSNCTRSGVRPIRSSSPERRIARVIRRSRPPRKVPLVLPRSSATQSRPTRRITRCRPETASSSMRRSQVAARPTVTSLALKERLPRPSTHRVNIPERPRGPAVSARSPRTCSGPRLPRAPSIAQHVGRPQPEDNPRGRRFWFAACRRGRGPATCLTRRATRFSVRPRKRISGVSMTDQRDTGRQQPASAPARGAGEDATVRLDPAGARAAAGGDERTVAIDPGSTDRTVAIEPERTGGGAGGDDRTLPLGDPRSKGPQDDERTIPVPEPSAPARQAAVEPSPVGAPAARQAPTQDAPAPSGGGGGGPGSASPRAAPRAPAPSEDVTIFRRPNEAETPVRPGSTARPRLLISERDGGVSEVPLTRPDTKIGRSTSCDIVLSDPEVSRAHAKIVERQGRHVLLPIAARESTFLNGQAVRTETVLADGDVLLLASQRLVYRESPDAKVTPPSRWWLPVVAATAVAGLVLAGVVLRGSLFRNGRGPAPAEKAADRPAPHETVPAAGSVPQPEARPSPEQPGTPAVTGAPGGREETVRKLLYQGHVRFLEHRYMSPPEGSAVFAYLEALKLDANNGRARSQLGRIVDDYLSWAEQATKQGNRSQALFYADKAAYIQRQA